MTDHSQERRVFGREVRNSTTQSGGIIQLLDREAPDGYRREWTERIAAADIGAAATTKSIVVFQIGDEWLSLPTQTVREITRSHSMHKLPHRDGLVLGLVCIRSQFSICVSLAAVLGIEAPVRSSRALSSGEVQVIVVNWENSSLAFPVDRVHCIHRYHPNDLRQIPSTLSEAAVVYTHGILQMSERSVGCLDEQLLFHNINRNLS